MYSEIMNCISFIFTFIILLSIIKISKKSQKNTYINYYYCVCNADMRMNADSF